VVANWILEVLFKRVVFLKKFGDVCKGFVGLLCCLHCVCMFEDLVCVD